MYPGFRRCNLQTIRPCRQWYSPQKWKESYTLLNIQYIHTRARTHNDIITLNDVVVHGTKNVVSLERVIHEVKINQSTQWDYTVQPGPHTATQAVSLCSTLRLCHTSWDCPCPPPRQHAMKYAWNRARAFSSLPASPVPETLQGISIVIKHLLVLLGSKGEGDKSQSDFPR